VTATATTWRSDYYTLGSTYPQCTARSHLVNIFINTLFKKKRSAQLCCDTSDIAHSGLWRPCSHTVGCARHEGQAAVQERLGAAAHAGSLRPAALAPARQRCLDGQRRRAQQQPRTRNAGRQQPLPTLMRPLCRVHAGHELCGQEPADVLRQLRAGPAQRLLRHRRLLPLDLASPHRHSFDC